MYCPNSECPDFQDTGVPGEYVEGITECPFCGSRLVEQMPDTKLSAEESKTDQKEREAKQEEEPFSPIEELDEELVVVASYSSRQDAELAITYLINKGIDVFESTDDCGGTLPAIGFAAGIRLLAPKSQSEQAMDFLKKIEQE
ncbi:MAG: hypothetical protein JW943_00290 [Deltaproteobacteria bacterium]|nr:hypothetical protein [Deltaproteobacteria bacterium]